MTRAAGAALFLGLLLPLAAIGATSESSTPWIRNGQAGYITKNIVGGTTAVYIPATGSATDQATPILSVTMCENIDVQLFDDFDGDATACTVAWQMQMCPQTTLANDTAKNNACANAPGVAALSGDSTSTDLAGVLIRFVGGGAGANITSCMIVVKCAIQGTD